MTRVKIFLILITSFSSAKLFSQELGKLIGKYKVIEHNIFFSENLKQTTKTFTSKNKVRDVIQTLNISPTFLLPISFSSTIYNDTVIYRTEKISDTSNSLRILETTKYSQGKIIEYSYDYGENWYKCKVKYNKKGQIVSINKDSNLPSNLEISYGQNGVIETIRIFERDHISWEIIGVK